MVQVSLDVDDLTNLRLTYPGPVLETVMAALALQRRAPHAPRQSHTSWRRAVAPRIASDFRVRRLLEVLPIVDLCLPAVGAAEVDDGLERLCELGPEYYRLELEMSAAARNPPRKVPRWTEQLAEQDPRPRRQLVDALRRLYDVGLRDDVAEAGATAARRFIGARAQDLALGGINQLMDNLHPCIRWHSPVLSIDVAGSARRAAPVPAGGLGVLVTPSILATSIQFHWDCNDTSPGALIFPIASPKAAAPPPGQRLARLIGRKRAAMLVLLAREKLCTSDLATRCGISPGAASEHARVLRDAGLITTDRSRRAMHSITPAGSALLATPVTTD